MIYQQIAVEMYCKLMNYTNTNYLSLPKTLRNRLDTANNLVEGCGGQLVSRQTIAAIIVGWNENNVTVDLQV